MRRHVPADGRCTAAPSPTSASTRPAAGVAGAARALTLRRCRRPAHPPTDLRFDQIDGLAGSIPVAGDAAGDRGALPPPARRRPVAELLAVTRLVGMHVPGLHSMLSSFDLTLELPPIPTAGLALVYRVDVRRRPVLEGRPPRRRADACTAPSRRSSGRRRPTRRRHRRSSCRTSSTASAPSWSAARGASARRRCSCSPPAAPTSASRTTGAPTMRPASPPRPRRRRPPARRRRPRRGLGRDHRRRLAADPARLVRVAPDLRRRPRLRTARRSSTGSAPSTSTRSSRTVERLDADTLAAILWPSSAAVTTDVPGLAEYADAKRIGEQACSRARGRTPAPRRARTPVPAPAHRPDGVVRARRRRRPGPARARRAAGVLRPATGLTPTLTGVSDPLISLFAEGLGVDPASLIRRHVARQHHRVGQPRGDHARVVDRGAVRRAAERPGDHEDADDRPRTQRAAGQGRHRDLTRHAIREREHATHRSRRPPPRGPRRRGRVARPHPQHRLTPGIAPPGRRVLVAASFTANHIAPGLGTALHAHEPHRGVPDDHVRRLQPAVPAVPHARRVRRARGRRRGAAVAHRGRVRARLPRMGQRRERRARAPHRRRVRARRVDRRRRHAKRRDVRGVRRPRADRVRARPPRPGVPHRAGRAAARDEHRARRRARAHVGRPPAPRRDAARARQHRHVRPPQLGDVPATARRLVRVPRRPVDRRCHRAPARVCRRR